MNPEFIKLIPVIVGGLLAVSGGLCSQLVIHFLSEKREKSKNQRERIESLVKSVYAHQQWISDKHNSYVFRNEDYDKPSPIDEAKVIQALYFPELGKELLSVQEATLPLMKFSSDQRIKHMNDRKTFIAEYDDEPFNEAYKKLLSAISVLVVKARILLNDS